MDEEQIAALLLGRVVALTGAGISAASGLPTFRGNNGLYKGLNPYELASPEAFARHPATVWQWYQMRIREGIKAKPNAAHLALAELDAISEDVIIITSNVDPLHRLAGSKRVFQLHGDILETLCPKCEEVADLTMDIIEMEITQANLPRCSCGGLLRPNVVWFGEYPREDAFLAFETEIPLCNLFLEIGTSGVVSYNFTQKAAHRGVPTVRINPEGEREPGVILIKEPSEVALPRLVESVKQFA